MAFGLSMQAADIIGESLLNQLLQVLYLYSKYQAGWLIRLYHLSLLFASWQTLQRGFDSPSNSNLFRHHQVHHVIKLQIENRTNYNNMLSTSFQSESIVI